MLKAILFDLDDTLYEERDFFRSGFAVVADVLHTRGIGNRGEIRELLEHLHHNEGREGVFQKLAARLEFPREWIPELVSAFRCHEPDIRLCEDALEALLTLRKRYRLGVVTDGWSSVQKRKIGALGLSPLIDAIVVTDELGASYWKPHAFPFQECLRRLGVVSDEAIFIGDHPERDQRGAFNAGLKFVRIRRVGGYFAPTTAECTYLPVAEVTSLRGLEDIISGNLAVGS